MSDQPKKTIGNMNGPWAILFKTFLAIIPFMMPWGVWVSKSVIELNSFMKKGDRFSSSDGTSMEMRIRKDIHEWELRMTRDLQNLENELTKDFVRKDELTNINK